jgi:hypothetical protein
MTTLPLARYRSALETYIDAKDNTRAERIAEVFASDAVLTFSLATSNIAFPARTVGAAAIAKTLVSDFGAQYAQCRTYYVCDSLAVEDDRIDALPWLVVMREPATRALRVGHGVYRWTFGSAGATVEARLVSAFHIHIARMDVVSDSDGALLEALQEGLSYPWLTPVELRERFEALAGTIPALAFVRDFAEPATPAASFVPSSRV